MATVPWVEDQQVLLLNIGAEGADDGVEIDQTILILRRRNVHRSLRCSGRQLVRRQLFMGLEVGNDGILDIALGLQDGIPVIHQQLLEQGVLQPDIALRRP